MKKNIIVAILAVALLSGCAVKKTDNLAVKTMKHTVNAPAYVGAVAVFAVIGTLALTAKGVVETKNLIVGKSEKKVDEIDKKEEIVKK
ncbi:MAG: hypothetical protein ACERKK_05955 [Poseidonibacter sp.]|uniref:hypothetical protein n=1 Tax=Poseidonibacter sp. TaxID=2321188 RepID=UPI00359EF96E